MKRIALRNTINGRPAFAIVDDESFEKVAPYKWRYEKRGALLIPTASYKSPEGKRVILRMHEVVTGASRRRVTHLDGDGLNNRLANLVVRDAAPTLCTGDRGALAEATVVASLYEQGYTAFKPFDSHSPVDLIAMNGPDLIRIQVKYRSATGNTVEVSLRNVHTNGKGAVSKPIDLSLLDVFAIYCPQTRAVYFAPVSACRDKASLTLHLSSAATRLSAVSAHKRHNGAYENVKFGEIVYAEQNVVSN